MDSSSRFFNPLVISGFLVARGIAIIVIERLALQRMIASIDEITPAQAVKIGLCQALAMIPGTSRSGATVMGGLIFGLDRRTAVEFSFLFAIPTMFAASGYDLYRNSELVAGDNAVLLVIGFSAAFISALVGVCWLVSFVSRHQFSLFGWYRIVAGIAMTTWLLRVG